MRYGFEHFRVQRDHLRPLMTQSYQNLFRALLGTRTDWTWFSIARMRKSVTVEDRNARQLANALIIATENQRKHSAAKNTPTVSWLFGIFVARLPSTRSRAPRARHLPSNSRPKLKRQRHDRDASHG